MDGCGSHTWLQLIPGTLSDFPQSWVFASIHLVFHLLQCSSDFFPRESRTVFLLKRCVKIVGGFLFCFILMLMVFVFQQESIAL